MSNTKTDSDKDANNGISLNANYSIIDNLLIRGGYNIQQANNSSPNADYLNRITFGEIDWTIAKKRAIHFVLRGERNVYNHEEDSQNYRESRIIAKITGSF